MAKDTSELEQIAPDLIAPNPDNPRLIFREREMSQLLDSISRHGIKVPLAVYREGNGFGLIDGERRWRCALRLNMPKVPALVQPKLDRLENILMMFNIHNVRVDWDLMPMALKIGVVRELAESQGHPTSPADLAGLTGVPLPTVRRALELLDLPAKHRKLLLAEAEKPKEEQSITADVYIEVLKSQRVIKRYVPAVFEETTEGEYLDVMVEKYRAGVVKNVVRYRDVSRIARAERAGEDPEVAQRALIRLIREPKRTIEKAYESTVRVAYLDRDLTTRAAGLSDRLEILRDEGEPLSEALSEELTRLRRLIDEIMG